MSGSFDGDRPLTRHERASRVRASLSHKGRGTSAATGSPTRSARSTATSAAASVRSAWLGLSDCSSSVFAVRRFNSRTITSPACVFTTTRSPRRIGVRRRHHDDVAVAIGGLHLVAGNLQRVGMLVIDRGQRHLVPALAGREPAIVEMAAGCRPARSRAAAPICTVRALSPINCTKLSMELLVAASALATNSVEGQRSRPSGVMRLDLLKVVGSRPARLASPEADSPARSASRSSAVQIWSWVSDSRRFWLFGHRFGRCSEI